MPAALQRVQLTRVIAQSSLQIANLLTLQGARAYRVGLRGKAFFKLFLADIYLLSELFFCPDLDTHASRISLFSEPCAECAECAERADKKLKKILP